MKNKLLYISLLASLNLYGADYDLRKGIDLTGVTSVTASQLNQLVDNGTINTNKGLVFITAGNTNPTATPFGRGQLTNSLWLDRATDPPVIKSYGSAGWSAATLPDGSVTTPKLANGAVTQAKLAADSVDSTNIISQSILSGDIAPLNIVESLLGPQAVTRSKIADGAVDNTKLTNNAVYGTNILDGAVSSNKIGAGQVTLDKLATSIFGTNIQSGTITSNNIAGRTIVATNIATNTITGAEIATGTIAPTNLNSSARSLLPRAWFSGTLSSSGVTWADAGATNQCSVVAPSAYLLTITFATAMGSTNYAVVNAPTYQATGATKSAHVLYQTNKTVGGIQFIILNYDGGAPGTATTPVSCVFFDN